MAYERSQLGRPQPKPIVHGYHWTDEDFAPFAIDDYNMHEQSVRAQMMLELAEMLADARREFALAEARANMDRIGAQAAGHGLYSPRVYENINHRRGYSVSRGSS